MALKWIIGDFATGNTSMTAAANQLPVVANSGDKISIDINGAESASITVSKNDLPSDWRTFLKPLDKFVALVDPDLAWGSSVIWAGFINKAQAAVNDTVKIQAAGLREYMAMRIVSKTYNSTVVNPSTVITFSGSTHQRLMANMILDCFSATGVPSNAPKPPQVLRSVSGSGTGTTFNHSVNLGDFETYSNMLDAWRDELSDAGQEYNFTPSWDSSAMTRIRWTGAVAPVSTPHFNEATTYSINLNSDAWMPTAYSQSSSTDNMVSRIIGQSKSGDGTTGSDYTTKTTTSGSSILVDETWNPGVELTTAEMTTQLTQRLSYNSQTYKEATFERAYSTVSDLRTIMGYLGGTATFTGSGASQYFGLTMRIVGLSFSPSKRIVSIDLAPKAARYPRLPKDRRNIKPRQETTNTGRPRPGVGGLPPAGPGDYGAPIVPPKKPGDNGTTPIPGGIPKPPEPVIPPPFTVPNDDFVDETSVIQKYDARVFKTAVQLAAENGTTHIAEWRPFIDPTRSRFNHNTGELIGINMAYQTLYHHSSGAIDVAGDTNYLGADFNDLKLYSIDFGNLFNNSTSTKYEDRPMNSTGYEADEHKKLIGTLPRSLYSDLELSLSDYYQNLPYRYNNWSYSAIRGNFDYIFFCSEDFQTLYIQVIYTIASWNKEPSVLQDKPASYSTSFSKVFKGVRNAEGVVETWENLGQALTQNAGSETAQIIVCPSIYEINGQLKAFGRYLLPQVEDVVEVKLKSNGNGVVGPHYAVKFYDHQIMNINLGGIHGSAAPLNLPDIEDTYYGGTDEVEEYKVPYAINVNYKNKIIQIGVSRNKNNVSTFYSGGFDLVFKKVLQTQKETSELYVNATYRNQYPDELFKHSSKAPVKYKNNYILINGEGLFTNSWQIKGKKVRYTRSKNGFSDSVSGEFNIPDNKSSVSTPISQMIKIMNIQANNGNLLGAYSTYKEHAWAQNTVNNHTLLYSGFEYYIYDNKLYVISDSILTESYNSYDAINSTTTASTFSLHALKASYWIGQFNIDDTKL